MAAFWSRFRRHKLALAAAAFIVVVGFSTVFANVVAPYDQQKLDLDNMQAPPSRAHWFGTDTLGRDVFSRVLYGGRISLMVGVASMSVAALIGIALGALAGYYGRATDNLIMRVVDVMLSIPIFFLILILAAFFGTNMWTIVAIIGTTGWMHVARILRACLLSLKEKEFTEAARALGISSYRIILRHLLPNAAAPLIVAFTLGVAGAIMLESALSFLGFGIQPPTASWGNMLTDAQQTMIDTPWAAIFPGAMIFLTVLSLNFIGDGLRDALEASER